MKRNRKVKPHKYTSKQIQFLKKHSKECTCAGLTEIFNKHFRLSMSDNQMREVCRRRGFKFKITRIPPIKLTKAEILFLKKNVKGRTYAELADMFNKKFKRNYNRDCINNICLKRGYSNEMPWHWLPGHVPHNKGKKGYCSPGSEKGWFRPGHPGYKMNEAPLGSERISADGYVQIKISNTAQPTSRRWKGKQIIIWEKKYGPVPKGYCVVFLDGNNRNFRIDNLKMVSRAEHAVMCRRRLYSKNKQITKAAHAMAALSVAVSDKKESTFKGIKKRKMIFIDKTERRVYVTSGKIRGVKRYYVVRETKKGLFRLRKLKARATFEKAQEDLYKYVEKNKYQGWRVL